MFCQIEQAVLDHRLTPGTKLKELQLAQLFGVKRGTIRKVLTRLANSHLVVQQPNRGASIAQPSAEEGRDLFAARRTLESATVTALANQHTPTDIRRLQTLLAQEQDAYQRQQHQSALAQSVDFHRQLALMAGNSVIVEFLNNIIRRTPLVILTHLNHQRESHCRNQEHASIVDAIASGNAQQAAALMNQHLLHLETQIHHGHSDQLADLESALRLSPKPTSNHA